MENETNTNVYELGFHLVPTISKDEVAGTFGEIKMALETLGASFISEEMPKEMTLAYEMRTTINNKIEYFTNSYFAWIKFEISKDAIEKVKEMIEKRSDIIRFIIITTVKENTLAPRKLFEKKDGGRKKRDEKEELPMDKEAVDAELDKMLEDENTEEVSAVDEVLDEEAK